MLGRVGHGYTSMPEDFGTDRLNRAERAGAGIGEPSKRQYNTYVWADLPHRRDARTEFAPAPV
ncbi:hypothetical protein [Streptomyces sp. WAC08241]|uniref:hypothetical protein n=1 Tax=Streptomyces sp. WAC08241 TaxID=2487421 RepID=UPI000F7B5A16|nr:hypothetical protein [Streptomyces sp. WAC08241]RSS44553.1 hypothetical protein EF906_06915 [Streptomyces sp. WAC08241]